MKKLLILFGLSALIFLFLRCGKERGVIQPVLDGDPIRQAQKYFNDSVSPSPTGSANLRSSCPKDPQWSLAYTIPTVVGDAVVVPIQYSKSLHVRTNFGGGKLFDLNELTHLVVYRDAAHRYHVELVTDFPDSLMLKGGNSQFTGILLVEDWAGRRLRQYKYNPDGAILQADVIPPQSGKDARVAIQGVAVTTCFEIDGYNYSEGDPDDGFAWSEPIGCISSYYGVASNSGSGGGPSPIDYRGAAAVKVPTISVSAGGSPIADVQSYFKCFTNSSSIDHSYSVTLCISQPVPGTTTPWGFTKGGPAGSSTAKNIVNVGHTFLIFSENNAGNIITRNIGFYPQAMVTPPFPSDQGQLDNNEQTSYNIAITFNISNTQFFSMLNYAEIGNNPGYLYNLSSNNCTTFALHALAAGDVSLLPNQGSWPGGSGYDPGDLGQYVVSMQLPKNATRNTVENPHPNTGTCN